MIEGAEEECVERGSVSIGTARAVSNYSSAVPLGRNPPQALSSHFFCHTARPAKLAGQSSRACWARYSSRAADRERSARVVLVPLLISVTHCEKAEAGHELVTRQHPRHMLFSH